MTSRRVLGGIEVAVGALKVAEIKFKAQSGKEPIGLFIWSPAGETGTFYFETVKAALEHMHSLLKSPPPEGFELPQYKRNS